MQEKATRGGYAEAQQVCEAVAGRLEDPHFDAEQGDSGQETAHQAKRTWRTIQTIADQVGGQGDHAEAPQHQHQHEGAQALVRRAALGGRGGGDVHAAPS